MYSRLLEWSSGRQLAKVWILRPALHPSHRKSTFSKYYCYFHSLFSPILFPPHANSMVQRNKNTTSTQRSSNNSKSNSNCNSKSINNTRQQHNRASPVEAASLASCLVCFFGVTGDAVRSLKPPIGCLLRFLYGTVITVIQGWPRGISDHSVSSGDVWAVWFDSVTHGSSQLPASPGPVS